MYRYAFEDLSDDEFEHLIIDLCRDLFGEGVHSFSKGRDAGRDGYFDGTAKSYPSPTNPWNGKMIFQAKHTSILNASCSDKTFYGNMSSLLNKEIKKLKDELSGRGEEIDCYLLFTNRKLTGGIQLQIRNFLQKELNIENADIIGQEDLDYFMDSRQTLADKYNLRCLLLPDRFYEQDIRDVILSFSNKWSKVENPVNKDLQYIDKETKNKINKIDNNYFADIKEHSLQYFADIDDFLKDPQNAEYKDQYSNTASDLRGLLQQNFGKKSFKILLESIIQQVIGIDPKSEIFKKRRLVRIFVHYMYWNCDIGRKQ